MLFAGLPGAPVLNSPADGAKDLDATVILIWTPVGNETGYRIEVSNSPTFASFVIKDSVGRDTTCTLHALIAGTTYYWRVQARNSAGTGPSGTVLEFLVPGDETVAIDLIDPGTGKIRPLINQAFSAGTYRFASPGLFPAAGVYVLRRVSGSHREVKRVVIR